MDKKLEEIFIRQMLLPKEELAMQTMELLADKMDLQSKIDKAIKFIKESNTYYEITHYIPEDEKQFKINMGTLTNHLLDILKEGNNE